jgi:cytochrome c-type biogenesis protein CcmE
MKIKPLHIVALLVISVGIGIVVSTSGDASSYVCFSDARKMVSEGDDEKVHVVGILPKDASGRILGMTYQPENDPDFFRFILVDEKQEKVEVWYHNPRPADFERSEKIVVVGAMKDQHFEADKILMKCPSKYNEGEVKGEGA